MEKKTTLVFVVTLMMGICSCTPWQQGNRIKSAQKMNPFISVKSSLILSSECEDKSDCNYTYTLCTRLGQILKTAQDLFGNRDYNYTILGVNFSTRHQPNHWFPEYGDQRKYVVIQLTENALKNEREAIFQLSHEIIHILSPQETSVSTAFEEGWAMYFSIWYIESIYSRKNDMNTHYIRRIINRRDTYSEAYTCVSELIKINGGFELFASRIKQYRRSNPPPESMFSKTALKKIFPKISPAQEHYLLTAQRY